jgi:hypothetical protein
LRGIVFAVLRAMTEQQFALELKECCDRVLPDLSFDIVDREYIDNMDFVFHDGMQSWVEYSGTKLGNYDRKAVDILGRIVHAVCNKHNILFINALRD